MQTLTRPAPNAKPTGDSADVAGRIATHMIHAAGSYGRHAAATMFLWLLATRDTPPQSDF